MFRFLTPVVRICLLVGMAMGFFLGLYLALGVPPDERENIVVTHPPARTGIAIVSALSVAGAFFGAIAGLVLEWAVAEKNESNRKKHWWRHKKSTRHKH
jgi:predicted benzoate:H+ symporter BenE